jgi:hypothetical protein
MGLRDRVHPVTNDNHELRAAAMAALFVDGWNILYELAM